MNENITFVEKNDAQTRHREVRLSESCQIRIHATIKSPYTLAYSMVMLTITISNRVSPSLTPQPLHQASNTQTPTHPPTSHPSTRHTSSSPQTQTHSSSKPPHSSHSTQTPYYTPSPTPETRPKATSETPPPPLPSRPSPTNSD